ncbi:unnamed protein product [Malus baccata var. baccata]|uniref:PPPDE domain-containing protein n=1 Tax=Malus baccata TaxID=106549 RepID=A0A540M9X3_MALBA|nr:hypothetical protein C1H46_018900 [Malus baccata]
MLCKKSVCRSAIEEEEEDSGSVPVYLNVYDLSPFNGYAYWLGLGVYHSGVQVHGVEYAFGAHEHPTSGIFEGEPKKCDGFTFRKSILIGKTIVGPLEVRAVWEGLAAKYKGNAYNLVTKNCNHFCNDACITLTGNPIPSWVNRLARIGFLCNCVLPVTLKNLAKVHRIEDKADDGDKNKLTSQSNNVAISSNSPSSSPSSPSGTTLRRGRSRTRRPRPPSSPLIIASSSS